MASAILAAKIGIGLFIVSMFAGYTYLWVKWVEMEVARDAALIHHNFYRSRHGSAPLTRNADLDMLAQMCAEYYIRIGVFDHSCRYRRSGYNVYIDGGTGENGYGSSRSMERWTYFEAAVGGSWAFYKESYNYNYSDHKTDLETHFGNVGHFTQMVWRETKQMGLGIARNSNGAMFCAFLYYPPGNVWTDEKEFFPVNVKPVLSNVPALREWRG